MVSLLQWINHLGQPFSIFFFSILAFSCFSAFLLPMTCGRLWLATIGEQVQQMNYSWIQRPMVLDVLDVFSFYIGRGGGIKWARKKEKKEDYNSFVRLYGNFGLVVFWWVTANLQDTGWNSKWKQKKELDVSPPTHPPHSGMMMLYQLSSRIIHKYTFRHSLSSSSLTHNRKYETSSQACHYKDIQELVKTNMATSDVVNDYHKVKQKIFWKKSTCQLSQVKL